jgi:hypothetical protein
MTPQQQMIAKYGMPGPAYEAKFCTLWAIQEDFPWFPVAKVFINTDFKALMYAGLKKVEADGLHAQIVTFDGCLSERPVRGSSAISMHSWAAAMDLNRTAGHMVQGVPVSQITTAQRLGPWSQQFVDDMKSVGLYFGGDFIHRPDPMHWSLLDE